MKLVDLGADFRLRGAADYEKWYGEPHRAPELLGRFVYGMPELHRAAIAGAAGGGGGGLLPDRGDPGAEAAARPDRSGTINVSAASGVSGAGKALKEASHFNRVDENFAAYGLLNHRHTAEMEMALGGTILFTPHLAPMNRGILATCTASRRGPAIRSPRLR